MVVKRCCSLVEPASVPRVRKSEPMEVEMVTELVAERTQEGAVGCDLFPYRSPHPDPDQHGFWTVVAEEFGGPVLTYPQRSSREYANAAWRDSVETRGLSQEVGAAVPDIGALSCFRREFEPLCNLQQRLVLRQVKGCDAVAFDITGAICPSRWRVGQHSTSSLHEN